MCFASKGDICVRLGFYLFGEKEWIVLGFFFFVSQNSPLIFGENQSCNGVREAKKMSGKKKVLFSLVYFAVRQNKGTT